MNLKKKIQSFPHSPGIYLMKDAGGEIIYVGKAVSLRDRVSNYFNQGQDRRYQIGALMKRTHAIEYIVTKSEKAAMLLEYEMIQKYRPRYNIMFRDDKSFARIKLGTYHRFPGIYVTRKVPKDGSTYFGPHPSASSCRDTVDLIIRYFKIRNCSDTFFANRSRPCIQYEIGRCSAPCVGYVNDDEYREQLDDAILFLEGKVTDLVGGLKDEMARASDGQRYEKAAHIRDVIDSIERVVGNCGCRGTGVPVHRRGKREEWNTIEKILTKKLALTGPPKTIECVDISNISGRYAVGSIACFDDGQPEKGGYRHYRIKPGDEPDDYGMIKEVLVRRFQRTPFPDLLLVDGGKGQLMIVRSVINMLKIEGVALAAISKGKDRNQDQIFLPGRKNPVKFRRCDPAYLFLQRIRDEAHRFGITHYRRRHRKGLFESQLNVIPGIGPARRKALLMRFGSVKEIKRAGLSELAKIPGIGFSLARIIKSSL